MAMQGGCAASYTQYDVFDRDPKLVALRSLLRSEAEQRLADGASTVYHCISVEPHMDAGDPGFTSSSGGRADGYSYQFYCSTRTIRRANTATGMLLLRYRDGRIETQDEVYFWEGGRWLTFNQWLERHHPKEWKAVQEAERIAQRQRLYREGHTSPASTAPVAQPK